MAGKTPRMYDGVRCTVGCMNTKTKYRQCKLCSNEINCIHHWNLPQACQFLWILDHQRRMIQQFDNLHKMTVT